MDAAEQLFYGRGIQAVGMAEIRQASGVSLKRLYQCFASKEDLVDAYLRRRDQRWHQALAEHIDRHRSPERRLLAVFDFLAAWFDTSDFRGCAFINAFGELGAVSTPVAGLARAHKCALRAQLRALAVEADAEDAEALADQLLLLVEGAIVAAAMRQTHHCPAEQGKAAARGLLNAHLSTTTPDLSAPPGE
nr:TetR/AcrR family transcriptional regulator [Prauserella isguenensis]